jgi:uncharacterized LabA/DUF88 family protein
MTNQMQADSAMERHSAVLIDYQNLYYYLKNRMANAANPSDHILDLLEALREQLSEDGTPITVGSAYADFSGLDEHARHVQRALYLMGFNPCFVPSTMHRNTTDLQLCIDAVNMLQQRPDIRTYVIVAGDRDYVPLVQTLLAHGVQVVMVAFREHLSARLFENTGTGYFLPAETLLSSENREQLRDDHFVSASPEESTDFNDPTDLPYSIDRDALQIIEEYFGQYEEIYLTPLLRRLSEELGDIEDHDPKSLIGDLEEAGAVRLERRKGMPYDYTVLIVNSKHPAVIDVRDEMNRARPATNGAGFHSEEFDEEDWNGASEEEASTEEA